MKKVGIGLAVLLLAGLGLLLGLSGSGIGFGFDLASGDKSRLRNFAFSFLEDLQYKDFDKAAKYHTQGDQKNVDIPQLIERLFKVKPEVLNIKNIRIVKVTKDRSGKRARTFFKATTEVLNTKRNAREGQNEEREVEGILYWHKRPAEEALSKDGKLATVPELLEGEDEDGEKWFMQLESSLH